MTKFIHVDQHSLQQRLTPQGNFTILPTDVVTLPTETGLGECHPPTSPLAPGLCKVIGECRSFHPHVLGFLLAIAQPRFKVAPRIIKRHFSQLMICNYFFFKNWIPNKSILWLVICLKSRDSPRHFLFRHQYDFQDCILQPNTLLLKIRRCFLNMDQKYGNPLKFTLRFSSDVWDY